MNNNRLKQSIILGVSFMFFFLLIKIGISFFSNGGYQPMLEDLFLAGNWKRTLLSVFLGGVFYSLFMYFFGNKKK